MAKQGFEASDGSEFEEFSDFELKAAEVLVKGTSDSGLGLLNILLDIFDSNRQSISEGDCKVRPGYAYDKFYLNRVGGSYDMSLEGLIHHIMFEEKLYHLFLNEQQINKVQTLVENSPESIYRPDIEDDDNQFANDIIDVVFSVVSIWMGQILLEYGGDNIISLFNEGGYEINENDASLIGNIITEVKDGLDLEDLSEDYDISRLDEHTLGILEAMKTFI